MATLTIWTDGLKKLYKSKIRTIATTALVVLSLIWIIYDWAHLNQLNVRAGNFVHLATWLAVTEACFIVGAILMAASLGVGVVREQGRIRDWLKHLHHVRRQSKSLASTLIDSKIFALGFWLNFLGAVGSSLVLVAFVLHVSPLTGSGLLFVLLVDLAASFGWRIPLHLKRRAHMKATKIKVRAATPADIDSYLKLQAERWQDDNMATREQLESRYKAYPEGMLVAERAGQIVGMVYAMQISDYDYENPPTWNEITNNGFCDNADPNGAVIFGVDLSTAKGVGHLAGDELLLGIARLVIARGLRTALLGGRMPGYSEYAGKMSAEEYLRAKDENGLPLDKQVRYYTGIPGLKAIKVLPNYFHDPASLDYGVLLRWTNPLFGLPGPRLWASMFPLLFELEEFYLKLAK
jgi:hypothetical protein